MIRSNRELLVVLTKIQEKEKVAVIRLSMISFSLSARSLARGRKVYTSHHLPPCLHVRTGGGGGG